MPLLTHPVSTTHPSTNGTSTGTGAGKTRGSGSGSGGRSTTTATRNPSSLASIAEENPEPYDYLARAVGPFEAQQAKLSELKKSEFSVLFSYVSSEGREVIVGILVLCAWGRCIYAPLSQFLRLQCIPIRIYPPLPFAISLFPLLQLVVTISGSEYA